MRASDWSTLVFWIESDTDVVEGRWIAQNSSFDLNILKKILKILRPKVDVWAHLGLNVKHGLNHTIWGSFESSWTLEAEKIIKKFCVQKWTFGNIWGLKFETPLNHTIWGSFERSWALENEKNNEKKFASINGRLNILEVEQAKSEPTQIFFVFFHQYSAWGFQLLFQSAEKVSRKTLMSRKTLKSSRYSY